MPEEEIYFENLRSQTVNLLEELKHSHNKEILQDKISSLWKNIPYQNIKKESDLYISKCKYEHSEETTLYMIIYHLLSTGNEEVVNIFYNEYNGKFKKFILICINNYKEFVSYTNKFKEGDYSIKNFVNQLGISNNMIYYYSIYKFLEENDHKIAIKELRNNINQIASDYTNESKQYLKCLVFPNYLQSKKQEVIRILKNLFIKEFCKLRDYVHVDFLPMVFKQGCVGYNFLQKNNFAFKNFEDIVLPVEIPLNGAKKFHSLFVCPVIKEVCSDENKPVLLECNHVISSSAANILCKYGAVDVFKCPYCPGMSGYEKILKLEIYK